MTDSLGKRELFPRPLFDRLMLDERGRGAAPGLGAREYIEAIRRDVEVLLNSRSRLKMEEQLPDGELWSVTEYGLPDFSHLTPQSSDDRQALIRAVTAALDRFEPRLREVEVEASIPPDGECLSLELSITACLAVDGSHFRHIHHFPPR